MYTMFGICIGTYMDNFFVYFRNLSSANGYLQMHQITVLLTDTYVVIVLLYRTRLYLFFPVFVSMFFIVF